MKLPFAFSLKLVFRLLLPGFVLALGLYPAISSFIASIVGRSIETGYLLTPTVVIAGWLIVILDMHIYMLFEGRRYWPLRVFSLGAKLENRRLARLKIKIEQRACDERSYLEASVEIRRFPLDEHGQSCVKFPTRLGNLLASYEEYSNRIYGMEAPFYWPRIWLTLTKELRDEIDGQQAIVDGILYTSVALFASGVLMALYAAVEHWSPRLIVRGSSPGWLGCTAAIAFISGYALYRSSLHLHAQFGETFKAVFDLFRKNVSVTELLEEIAHLSQDPSIKGDPKTGYTAVWRYLHNYRVKCRGSGKSLSPGEAARQVGRPSDP